MCPLLPFAHMPLLFVNVWYCINAWGLTNCSWTVCVAWGLHGHDLWQNLSTIMAWHAPWSVLVCTQMISGHCVQADAPQGAVAWSGCAAKHALMTHSRCQHAHAVHVGTIHVHAGTIMCQLLASNHVPKRCHCHPHSLLSHKYL